MKNRILRITAALTILTSSAFTFAAGGCGGYLECLLNPTAPQCACHTSK